MAIDSDTVMLLKWSYCHRIVLDHLSTPIQLYGSLPERWHSSPGNTEWHTMKWPLTVTLSCYWNGVTVTGLCYYRVCSGSALTDDIHMAHKLLHHQSPYNQSQHGTYNHCTIDNNLCVDTFCFCTIQLIFKWKHAKVILFCTSKFYNRWIYSNKLTWSFSI